MRRVVIGWLIIVVGLTAFTVYLLNIVTISNNSTILPDIGYLFDPKDQGREGLVNSFYYSSSADKSSNIAGADLAVNSGAPEIKALLQGETPGPLGRGQIDVAYYLTNSPSMIFSINDKYRCSFIASVGEQTEPEREQAVKLVKHIDLGYYGMNFYFIPETKSVAGLEYSIVCIANSNKVLSNVTFSKFRLHIRRGSTYAIEKKVAQDYLNCQSECHTGTVTYEIGIMDDTLQLPEDLSVRTDAARVSNSPLTYKISPNDEFDISWSDDILAQMRDLLIIIAGGLFGVVTTTAIELYKSIVEAGRSRRRSEAASHFKG